MLESCARMAGDAGLFQIVQRITGGVAERRAAAAFSMVRKGVASGSAPARMRRHMPTCLRVHALGLLLLPLLPPQALMAQLPEGSPLEVSIRRALPAEDETLPPFDTSTLSRVLPEGRKSVYTRCETAHPLLAITFDDGPDPVLTPRLLDVLKERGVKATFFLVGRNVAAFPAIVKRMVEEGHEVANHSWSHPLLTQLGAQGVESQLRRAHDAIVKACGVAPLLYRPPYGAVGMSQRARIEKAFGYPAILWDVDPLDWQKPRLAQKVYDRVLAQARPGSIILCHDIHETTVAAMPVVLNDLKARGYAFATVTQLIALTTPPPAPVASAAPAEPVPAQLPQPAAAEAPAAKLIDTQPPTPPAPGRTE